MAIRIIALLLFLFPVCAHAQQLPDAPKPKPEALLNPEGVPGKRSSELNVRFYDREAKIELATNVTLLGLDSGLTCYNLATGGREGGLPTQRCAPAVAIMSAALVGQEIVSYLLYRSGHHRLAHVLRIPTAAGHLRGALAYRGGFEGHGCSRLNANGFGPYRWNGQTCIN